MNDRINGFEIENIKRIKTVSNEPDRKQIDDQHGNDRQDNQDDESDNKYVGVNRDLRGNY